MDSLGKPIRTPARVLEANSSVNNTTTILKEPNDDSSLLEVNAMIAVSAAGVEG
ncbi:hypothetical protein DAPPUDRAFT_235832 [Daphnia pulex]|uniref:Uncharacterized protein n=1 Tax=Daphnia pulex TaxID=6669 RepID=E9G0Z4_DAPPU|nr:hypothetical protein DAPPUDRAFT_235832 [Daphnia pulex]|eukprot:EFX87319.1 hypothetical protein DAPPUDRAFT_235832 [Daphnia pulex]